MDRRAILVALRQLVAGDQILTSIFTKFINIEICDETEYRAIVKRLSELLWNENYTIKTAELFSPLLLEILTHTSKFPDDNSSDSYARHEWLCICLSKLIWNYPTVGRFSKIYFDKNRNLFWRYEGEEQPPTKKTKTEAISPSSHQLLKAAYLFLIYDTPFFKDLWSWAVIVQFLKKTDVKTRWYAHQCLGRVGNIKDSDLALILEDNFTKEEFALCAKEGLELSSLWNHKLYNPLPKELYANIDSENSLCNLTTKTVNVQNILLSKIQDAETSTATRMVCVASVAETLYSLGLAISSSEAILLKGPVGCGKTSLVEFLASATGRTPSENFVKVQLGDHMDSKMLLGTHCCTDVPGQFIWKAGVLVNAMVEGHWLLLEDIDCAPMDVISLLVPVLQSKTIVLPGHANPVKAAPGFQLFATQRLISGMDGTYVEFKNNAEIIDKQWRKIRVNPLTEAELTQVIKSKWPELDIVISRILQTYALFSPDFKTSQVCEGLETFKADFKHGRLITMRDLFKFCGRIVDGFDSSKAETSVNVFKHAIDCFCDSIPNPETRLLAAEAIAVIYNLNKAKAKLLLETFKPDMEISDPLVIGRAKIPKKPIKITFKSAPKEVFAHSRQAVSLLEKVAVAVVKKEPVLLVGETGTGKTSIVQHLAGMINQKLIVINMSQQSDSTDLLGGYKPIDFFHALQPIKDEFIELFSRFVDVNAGRNAKFLVHTSELFLAKKYDMLFRVMLESSKAIVQLLLNKYPNSEEHLEMVGRWRTLREKIDCTKKQIQQSKTELAFKFIEGALIKAMRNGEWLLLDEINLAEAETLECLAGILENDDNSLVLLEKGDNEPVKRHPDFHIFACMNPATDIGKKDLPAGIRSRFTEFFVEELKAGTGMILLVIEYLRNLAVSDNVIEKVVKFYSFIKAKAAKDLNDGTGHHPHYSLRTLCRALKYASTNPCHNVPRSLYEGFCLSFLSQLDGPSHAIVSKAIAEGLIERKQASILKQCIPEPRRGKYVQISGYWILSGHMHPMIDESYIFTETVEQNLRDLARIVSACNYPVLLQGETSSGKTSLIQYLAHATGNRFVRVNNHEHTDIQEYVGTYSADEKGNLVFKEGVLVEAMRKGYWIILDELNLAPTEVMEALNRVLDDNRELFIAETQTTVKAKPGFMIFATQNPPGLYGGRKLLSRAFRNRFIELHFNEIPPPELEVILAKRCGLSLSHSKKLVGVMHELQMRRRESGVFAGKQGFITLRDLFRWGERYSNKDQVGQFYDWDQHLADEGYLLLAGRVRHNEEVRLIQEVIRKHLKRDIVPEKLFDLHDETSEVTKDILQRCLETVFTKEFKQIVWTRNMRRLAVLVGKAMQFNEPCLLVGNTGCGKTTMCQMFSEMFDYKLYTVNCHMHTEASDFLGGLRPTRDLKKRETQLFEWQDGPLIKAMTKGCFFLADEISLADHSVLERLNSVLEPDQKLLLTEKSHDSSSNLEIKAEEGFHFFATMNPGGDYGKKELSPALRNRFTEIWCPSDVSVESVKKIVDHNLDEILSKDIADVTAGYIADFMTFYSSNVYTKWTSITMRDILTWVEFINTMAYTSLTPSEAYLHGALLVFLDGLGSGQTGLENRKEMKETKLNFFSFIGQQVGGVNDPDVAALMAPDRVARFQNFRIGPNEDNSKFGIGKFFIEAGPYGMESESLNYVLHANTTKANALCVLRAMQLSKPVLLEGSPGVGKTSLIDALARASGHKLIRINLSEQTDVSDLFGADLPVENGETGQFAWRDGPLLQALKKGHWILLDELNLASQSVLEGLNACLDHRSEVFISELGKTIPIDKYTTRIFGCQNPHTQGGSRKGLPKSFLNRFSQVYIKPMETTDFQFILKNIHKEIPKPLIFKMLAFNNEIDFQVNQKRSFGRQGAPFEFNLRDVFRWCEAILSNQGDASDFNIGEYVRLLYADRMRNESDKMQVYNIFNKVMQETPNLPSQHNVMNRPLQLHVYEHSIQLGHSLVKCAGRNIANTSMMSVAIKQLPCLESVMKCIEMNWMPILIGPSGSGKSSMVRLLAELSGHHLHVMSVNSEMDTIELLGGFEQVDYNRKIGFIANDLEPVVQKAISRCIHPSATIENGRLEEILDHIHTLSNVKRNTSLQIKVQSLRLLVNVLEELKIPEAETVLTKCSKIVNDLCEKINSGETTTGGQFEWVDSILIHAATAGHWLLIDDANFCSPSVLDRLNSFLEPNGTLTISEQGVLGDGLRTIKSHPNFRIFLTMNPKNGEISRAMRNRGVEIFIEPIVSDVVDWKGILDVAAFAQCKGLVHSSAISKLFEVHNSLVQNTSIESPSLSDFLSAASLYVQFLQNHMDPKTAFLKVCRQVYEKLDISQFPLEVLPDVTKDLSLPLTSVLPTSIDYRHSAIFASIKKHSAVFTYFLKHLRIILKIQMEDVKMQEIFFPYPTPTFPSSSSVKDRFLCILRIIMESSSLETHRLLDIWLQYTLEYEIKREPLAGLKEILQSCLNLKKILNDQINDPLVVELLSIVSDTYNHAEFPEVRKNELPIDPRWEPAVYRQILFKVRENLACEGELNADQMISYKIEKLGNKYNLLLLWRKYEFVMTNAKNPSLTSLVQTEIVSRLLEKKKVNLEVVRQIPGFLSTVAVCLLELLRMDKWDCPDDCYWKFRDAMCSYFTCKQICEETVDTSLIEIQYIAFTIHFYWLTNKIRLLYSSDDVQLAFRFGEIVEDEETLIQLPIFIPEYVKDPFNIIIKLLAYKNPATIVRKKLLRNLEHPQGFTSSENSDIYKNALELYKVVNPLVHLSSTDVNSLNIVLSHRKDWMPHLMNAVEFSVFGSSEGSLNFEQVFKDVKDKLQLYGLMNVTKEDMEVCHFPPPVSVIPNKNTVADIQVLPLFDYFFNIYSLELLNHFPLKLEARGYMASWLQSVGCNILLVDPRHLGNIQRRVTSPGKEMDTLLTASTLTHTRQGFSSEGLFALQYKLTENNTKPIIPTLNFDSKYIWAKQVPLLTYICTLLFNKPSEAALMCRAPLGSYADKFDQIEVVKRALWTNYEKLINPHLSLRATTTHVIGSWIRRLLTTICLTLDPTFTRDQFTMKHVSMLFQRGDIYPLCISNGKLDILELAMKSVREMEGEIQRDIYNPKVMWATATSFVLVGLLTTMLTLPRDAVDPATKRNLKAKDYDKKLTNIQTEKAARDWICQVTNGQTLQEVSAMSCTPYLTGLDILHNTINVKRPRLQKKLVVRQKAGFERLKEMLHEYMISVGSPDIIYEILLGIYHEGKSAENKNANYNNLKKAENLMENQRSLVDVLTKKFSLYFDLTVPFIVGIEQIIYGMGLARQCVLLKEMDQHLKSKNFKNISDFLTKLVSFSFDSNPLHVVGLLLNGDNISTIKTLLTLGNVTPLVIGRLVYKLVKSAVLEIINVVKCTPQLNETTSKEILKSVTEAFGFLWQLWNAQEMEMKKKKEIEESLFIHKVKHHETEISEEEAIDLKLKASFPSYSNEFADCMTAEQDPLGQKEAPLDAAQEDLRLTPDDIFEVWQLHATVMSVLSPEEMKNSDENMKWVVDNRKEVDSVTPYLLRHEVVCEIVKTIPDRLDGTLDSKLMTGNIMMCHELQKKSKMSDKVYDIYHDPNSEEVEKVFPVLNKLEAHVLELLIEFPEHAQLVQILKLVQRVLSFPVTDPLMKFVIGMELVLDSIQLWDQMAHSQISLKFEAEELTKKIIEYRSMELNGWRSGLESVLRKQYKNSAKWWFHIFNLFTSLFQNPKSETEYPIIIKSLKQFLEESPLSEFPARLSILHTFLQQSKLSETVHKSKDENRLKRLSQMQNLYCYYEQFLPDIKNRIAQIRKPTEKEVKDYVKIARWNDVNFFAVKQSVEKSHRFVVKHVKSFEDALQAPAKLIFTLPSKKDLETYDGTQWFLDINPDYFVSKEQLVKQNFKDQKKVWLTKVPGKFTQIRKTSRKLAISLNVVNHINTLNQFSDNVMETLQNVIIDSGKKMCTRSQEKKQSLFLIQSKRQLLSTLLKNLVNIGLSYSRGMIFAKNRSDDDILSVSAFDVKSLQILKSDSAFRELLLKSSQDTSHYFYKSTAQYALLRNSMEAPNKDLTLDIVHRIQGFSGNLLAHVIDQREALVKTSRTIDEMGEFFDMLSNLLEGLHESPVVVPPQVDALNHQMLLNSLMVQYMTLVTQFESLMKCAPTTTTDNILGSLSQKLRLFTLPAKNTEGWNNIMANITQYTKELKKGFQSISSTPSQFITWKKVGQIVNDFETLTLSIQKVVSALGVDRQKNVHTGRSLNFLKLKILEAEKHLNAFRKQDLGVPSAEHRDSLLCAVKKLMEEVLLAFQDLKKECVVEEEDHSSRDVCPDELFTGKISKRMANFEEHLHFKNVLKLMLRLMRIVKRSCSTKERLRDSDVSLRLLANLSPFLQQYFQLAKVYLVTSVGMHRTSCKFLSVLLEVFNILATKGFCIPADLKEEAEKLGPMKFEDIEAGGLGEGEGTKDVSDKIESEDQLEDTLKAGEDKEENKEDKSDMKNEEHGIEMSEDFEGKSYDPEKGDEEAENEDESDEDQDLDKQMGEVDTEDAEKLDEKVWGSDSEDENDEVNEEDGTGGVTQDQQSELVAKDGLPKDMDDGKSKDKGQKPDETMEDQSDEYQGEHPDPMINAPQDEPEVVELPDDMEITDEDKGDKSDNEDTLEINYDPNEALESEADEKEEEAMDDEEAENSTKQAEEEVDDLNNATSAEPAAEEDGAGEEEGNDVKLPTHTPTMEPQALPSGDQSKSSRDPVNDDTGMDWENGTQPPQDQHKEGQADTKDAYDQGTGHEGKTSSVRQQSSEDQAYKPKLKTPSENRTLDDANENANIKQRPIADKQSQQKSHGPQEEGEADVYEHVEDLEDGVAQAVDIATEEQARIRPVQSQAEADDYDSDVICISSDDDEPVANLQDLRTQGDLVRQDQRQRPGEKGQFDDIDDMEIPEGEMAPTHKARRGDTTIHTQNDLWTSLSRRQFQEKRLLVEQDLFRHYGAAAASTGAVQMWQEYENLVAGLSQELCEQLRLVLEPTKMAKLKGDYRTGKRLNMRKIIPYIASQFRKDKIWLRRTKPSKRQYQIMLSVDDSSSMCDNHSKQLAFESLAVLGQALSLLEAGELSVVSFGETVELLLGFNEQFNTATGARIFQQFTFSQQKTRYKKMLDYATDALVQAKNKDSAQLLVILSDGRGVNNDGESAVREAVWRARENNIFMVFVIIDSPQNKDSILDISCPTFKDNKVTTKSYIENFPFPFYIILRDINTLPVVLGEALRQWFELVTSTER